MLILGPDTMRFQRVLLNTSAELPSGARIPKSSASSHKGRVIRRRHHYPLRHRRHQTYRMQHRHYPDPSQGVKDAHIHNTYNSSFFPFLAISIFSLSLPSCPRYRQLPTLPSSQTFQGHVSPKGSRRRCTQRKQEQTV